jgi:hypothetical protein
LASPYMANSYYRPLSINVKLIVVVFLWRSLLVTDPVCALARAPAWQTLYTKSMGHEHPGKKREGKAERGSRWLRNVNLLGAMALGSAAVVAPVFAPVLVPLAGLDVAQAGFFEVTRGMAKRRASKASKRK